MRCTNEEICPEYLRFQKRVVRMLNSLADTGKVDFSAAVIKSKYKAFDEGSILIANILDENTLIGEARFEMDIVLRHIIKYFSNQCKSIDELLRIHTHFLFHG
ncbi:hypothetical protein [Faecalicatena contorta]|uniref:hypothetical protein n=1 Tax=Faecalicatena contorta TaxID=39482 RepID=UPI000D6DA43B|nr:hypothetical protein [Faecalicatena contorta]